MSARLPVAVAATLAGTIVIAYLSAAVGAGILPGLAAAGGLLAGLVLQRAVPDGETGTAPASRTWWLLVVVVLAVLLGVTWPALLPPGGASDLTHHLLLVDVLDRTRHLVDGTASEAALGEMAHYTPGLHLLIVIASSMVGVDAYRAAYAVLAATVALKAGFLLLLGYHVLDAQRGRPPIAVAGVGLALFAPRAYSVDGFLSAGFFAQVAAELFVVAGWWGLARWWADRANAWMAFTGLMGAATFLTWPVWIGPLAVAVGLSLLSAPGLGWRSRWRVAALALTPVAAVAAIHVVQHSAWLRLAGTSGAVPRFAPDAAAGVLIVLALIGLARAWWWPRARVTIWFAAGLAAQAVALYALARMRGAETPYLAMKMIYLAVYPAAVLATLGLEPIARRIPRAAVWAMSLLICGAGIAHAVTRVPPSVVDVDLDHAGRWARTSLQPACVDYIVDNAEQAYWLHLAVLGQPRSSPRTADIDGYTTNRAIGRWIEGSTLPYAIARRDLLPGEVLRDADILRSFGTAVVIQRRGAGC